MQVRYVPKVILAVIGMALTTSCSQTRPLTSTEIQNKAEIRREKERALKLSTDTTIIHDSVFILIKGDTLIKERVKNVYRMIEKVDTMYLSFHDTIYVDSVKETIRQVELSWWERFKVDWGGVAMAIVLAGVAGVVIKLMV